MPCWGASVTVTGKESTSHQDYRTSRRPQGRGLTGLVSSEKNSGNGADWSSWSKTVSPEATFRCGLAMRRSKSFRLCENTKTKDSSPALIPSGIGGAAEPTNPALPNPSLQGSSKCSPGEPQRSYRAKAPAGGTTGPHLARRFICPFLIRG